MVLSIILSKDLEQVFKEVITESFIDFWLRIEYGILEEYFAVNNRSIFLIPYILKTCKNLIKLDAANSGVLVIPPELFIHCKEINTIVLYQTMLTFLSKEIAKLKKLEKLYLGCNPNLKLLDDITLPSNQKEPITGNDLSALLKAYGPE